MTLKRFCAELSKLTGREIKCRRWKECFDLLYDMFGDKPTAKRFSFSGFSGVIESDGTNVRLSYVAQLSVEASVKFEFWFEGAGISSEVVTVPGDYRNCGFHTFEIPMRVGTYRTRCRAYRAKKHNDPGYAPDWILMNEGSFRVRIA